MAYSETEDLHILYQEKYFHYEYSQAVAQLVKGVCVPSILVGFQDRTG